jgi:hypothetical protein
MAESATETGSSDEVPGSEDAGGTGSSSTPQSNSTMAFAGEHIEREGPGTPANVSMRDDRGDPSAAGQNETQRRARKKQSTSAGIPKGGKKRMARGVAVPALLESVRTHSDPEQKPRFRVFVIDTGWNEAAHKVLRKQLPLFDTLTVDTPTYWLDRETSVALLRRHRELIGRDPILCVHDLQAVKRRGSLGVHGLRLHLGLLRSEYALTRALQMVIHFLARNEMTDNFEAQVRSRLQLEGLRGAVAIMAGATPHNDLLRV